MHCVGPLLLGWLIFAPLSWAVGAISTVVLLGLVWGVRAATGPKWARRTAIGLVGVMWALLLATYAECELRAMQFPFISDGEKVVQSANGVLRTYMLAFAPLVPTAVMFSAAAWVSAKKFSRQLWAATA